MNAFPHFTENKEFEFLIQSRSEHYIKELTENIIGHGCQTPIETWENYIIDGHLRYEICSKWEIAFEIKELSFHNENDVLSYLCSLQLKRNDLTNEYQRYLLGRQLRAVMETTSIRHMEEHPELQLNPNGQVSQKYGSKYNIAAKIGTAHHLCTNTIIKYDIYAHALDYIRSIEPEIALKILYGNLYISHENIIELARLPKEDIRGLKQFLSEIGINHISYSQLRHELQWKGLPSGCPCTKTVRQRKKGSVAKIKQMPEPDPNAELTSLGYTVPSWIKIISHGIELTDFPSTSESARNKLKIELTHLNEKINILLSLLEDT